MAQREGTSVGRRGGRSMPWVTTRHARLLPRSRHQLSATRGARINLISAGQTMSCSHWTLAYFRGCFISRGRGGGKGQYLTNHIIGEYRPGYGNPGRYPHQLVQTGTAPHTNILGRIYSSTLQVPNALPTHEYNLPPRHNSEPLALSAGLGGRTERSSQSDIM